MGTAAETTLPARLRAGLIVVQSGEDRRVEIADEAREFLLVELEQKLSVRDQVCRSVGAIVPSI